MKHRMKLAAAAAVMTLMCSIQVFAGSWKQYGVNYVYYDGTPVNPGAVCNARVIEHGSSSSGYYELRIDGKTAGNRWLGIQREGETKLIWSYFDEKGRDFSGWKQIDGSWYYFANSIPSIGWHRIDQKYYYFDPVTYVMKNSGTEMRDGVEYEFAPDGVSRIVGGLVDAGENGTEGWKQENDKSYYLRDGQKVTNEWLKNGNDTYYVGADGARYAGCWQEIDGVLYYFNYNGTLSKNTTRHYNDHKYILDAEGHATEAAMGPEEMMENSNARKWCEYTYIIYTRSQERAELAARIQRVEIPDVAQLLERDWGITTKEQGIEMINRLADMGRADTAKSQKAWDFSRAMLLCESMQKMGWVTLAERLDMQLAIAPDIQNAFSSWNDYNESYMAGFRSWATDSAMISFREDAYERIKNDLATWTSWNQSLEKIW